MTDRLEWFHVRLALALATSCAFTVCFVRAHDTTYAAFSGIFTLFIAALLISSLLEAPANGQ